MNKYIICLGTNKDRMPIMIIDIYVLVTLYLYFFGPIHFLSQYSLLMAMYMLAFLIIINIAYFRAVWNKKNEIVNECCSNNTKLQPLPLWFYIVGALIPLLMVMSATVLSGFSGLNGSLTNTMAETYTYIQSGGRYQQGIDVPMWIYMHFAVFVYLTIFDGLLLFWQNNILRKVLWGGSLLLLVSYFVLFRGAQKTLGDVFILCASAVLIKIAVLGKRSKVNKKGLVILILMVIAFAIILATIMGSRISYLNSIGYNAFKLHTKYWDVDLQSSMLSFLPEATRIGFACLVFYLCNGLCGLSYCLATPFTWTYGLGTFPDLADIIGRRLGVEVYENTYMYKAYEIYGWHHSEYWHSLFPYLASDWTFVGALVVMGIIAYVYASCWIEIVKKKNKESMYLFSIMNIIWIYLPCNNQIFATRTTALVFIICFIIWARRNKHVIKKKFSYKFGW